MTIDFTKPIQTCRGEKAELVYDGLTSEWPLAVVIHLENGKKHLLTYTRKGVIDDNEPSFNDLMNVPVKHVREVWVNMYEKAQHPGMHYTRESADAHARDNRIACIPMTIEFEEGEGL